MKTAFFLLGALFIIISASAQIAVNTTGANPDASAGLDVSFTNKGVLIPRIALTSVSDNTTIPSPTTSLLVYNTGTGGLTPAGYYYWNGSQWVMLGLSNHTHANLTFDNSGSGAASGSSYNGSSALTVSYNTIGAASATHTHAVLSNGTGISALSYNGSSPASVSLTNTGVTAGTYGNTGANVPNITVDAQGRLTAASNRTLTASDLGLGAVLTFNNTGAGGASGTTYNGSTAQTISYNTIGAVGGSGVATRVAFWNSANTLSSNANLYWDNTNNRLGIGTATPAYTLDVSGFVRINSTTNPGRQYRIESSNRQEIYTTNDLVENVAGNKCVIVGTGGFGNDEFYIANSVEGNKFFVADGTNQFVGIGTITPTQRLDVVGNVRFSGALMPNGNAGTSGQVLVSQGAGNAPVWQTISAGISMGCATDNYVLKRQNATTASCSQIFDNGTSVMIGVTSSSNRFHVEGSVASPNAIGYFKNNYNTSSDAYGVYGYSRTNDFWGIGGQFEGGWYGVRGEVNPTGGSSYYGVRGYVNGSTGNTGSNYGVYGESYSSEASGTNYGVYGYSSGKSSGRTYGVYGYISPSNSSLSGYGYSYVNSAVYGFTYMGYPYTFGVAGYRWDDSYNRTGGTFGGSSIGSPPTAWGCLGYRNSGGTHYGVYGSNAYASGGGFLSSSILAHVGGGFYGNLIGSWSRGELMGQISCGEAFASYNLGNEYTTGYQAQIIQANDKNIVTYNTVSTDMKIYHDGYAKLNNGNAYVPFTNDLKNAMKDNKPVITVSPLGECNGLYISKISSDGFEVKELNNGSSNVEFSYIVIAKRADSENKSVPDFVLSRDFNNKLKEFMFNESNTTRNATPMWWDGSKLRFDAIPEGPKPDKQQELLKHKSAEELEKERKLEEALKKLREGK